ncbi:MAG: hypothetical protein KBS95_04920 [Alistipes sp.]|nr:hypothetical protein [Candidatus Alistipes equi]
MKFHLHAPALRRAHYLFAVVLLAFLTILAVWDLRHLTSLFAGLWQILLLPDGLHHVVDRPLGELGKTRKVFLQTVVYLRGRQELSLLQQVLDEVLIGIDLAPAPLELPSQPVVELGLEHSLIPTDGITSDTKFQGNLTLAEEFS